MRLESSDYFVALDAGKSKSVLEAHRFRHTSRGPEPRDYVRYNSSVVMFLVIRIGTAWRDAQLVISSRPGDVVRSGRRGRK